MPRDLDQIQAAAQYIANSVVADETTSLPPGYISGFNVTLAKDYTVTISAGTAYVAGRGVKLTEDHLLAATDWVAPRLDHPNHYYIYLDKTGSIRVDLVQPVYNNGYCYYEQPDYGWRAIGKIFLKNNDIIYAARQVERKGSTVTVAPFGFTGEADYYCTGTSDDIMINSAILYVYTAYWGGTVRLLEGTFTTSAPINASYYAITLKGSGQGTIIDRVSGTYAIQVVGTASSLISRVSLEDFRLVKNSADTSTSDGVYVYYGNEVSIKSLTFYNYQAKSINITNSKTTLVSQCRFVRPTTAAIWVYGSDGNQIVNNFVDGENSAQGATDGINVDDDEIGAIISGNTIRDLTATATNPVHGILLKASPNALITNNTLYNLNGFYAAWDGTTRGIDLIDCSYANITANTVNTLTNTNGTTYAVGIGCRGTSNYNTFSSNKVMNVTTVGMICVGTSNSFSSNYCYNNGSDTGIANTNGNNFSDSGTDTQVYSNSWQSPVSGEPAQGELHWAPQSTATTAYTNVIDGVTTTAAWASVSVGGIVPVGAKAILATVRVNASSSGAGTFYHFVSFSNDYSAAATYGDSRPNFGVLSYAAGAGERAQIRSQITIPIDSNRKFYYYAENRTNATGCNLSVFINGYLS